MRSSDRLGRPKREVAGAMTKAQLEAKLDFLRQSVRRHNDEAKEAKKSEQAARRELAALQSYVSTIDELAVAALNASVRRLTDANAELQKRNKQLDERAKELRAKLDRSERDRADLALELDQLERPRLVSAALNCAESWLGKLRDALEGE